MSLFSKAIIMAVLVGFFGIAAGFSVAAHKMELYLGLDLLYYLRGTRKPPADILIVNLDKALSQPLIASSAVQKWPRSLYAKLVDYLTEQGAKVIVFDVKFNAPGNTAEDQMFAKALRKAGNVIVFETLEAGQLPIAATDETPFTIAAVERIVPPIMPIAESATALAPFPLPKIPVKLCQYWTFKSSAGNIPTLPVMTFHFVSRQLFEDYIRYLNAARPAVLPEICGMLQRLIDDNAIQKIPYYLRDTIKDRPRIGHILLSEVRGLDDSRFTPSEKKILRSLFKVYQGDDSQYLNFYGPAGTIPTISYNHIIDPENNFRPLPSQLNLKGKVVFVGFSQLLRAEQEDNFYTVYSQSDGIDISGVEVAATAYANLLTDMPVTPLSLFSQMALLLIFGGLAGFLGRYYTFNIAFAVLMAFNMSYLFLAHRLFAGFGIWCPLILPLFFISPLALFGSLLWRYHDTNKERQHIKKAFGLYLPDTIVNQLAKDMADINVGDKVVYGTCLFTDLEKYTTISEAIAPDELSKMMNRYYETMFGPVKQHGGSVTCITGDAMLALWVGSYSPKSLQECACAAALDIKDALQSFDHQKDTLRLHTRIGMHAGNMFLGNIGAMDHYEYTPMGDVVNTASRIEGLNKYLGTQILVSEDVGINTGDFAVREMGRFLLTGKMAPISIYELICRSEDTGQKIVDLQGLFHDALSAYRNRLFDKALNLFERIHETHGNDGPTLLYISLCRDYQANPPCDDWDGTIILKKK